MKVIRSLSRPAVFIAAMALALFNATGCQQQPGKVATGGPVAIAAQGEYVFVVQDGALYQFRASDLLPLKSMPVGTIAEPAPIITDGQPAPPEQPATRE